MSAEVARMLRAAADLIEPPGRWTQHASARDGEGQVTFPNDSDAVCWCAIGAIERAAISVPYETLKAAFDALRRTVAIVFVGCWNDAQPSVEPVVAALRAAADAVEAEEARA